MTIEEHRQAFLAFVAGLLSDADRYLERPDFDPLRDGVSYRVAGMWLDDAEFAALLRDLAIVLQPRLATARPAASIQESSQRRPDPRTAAPWGTSFSENPESLSSGRGEVMSAR